MRRRRDHRSSAFEHWSTDLECEFKRRNVAFFVICSSRGLGMDEVSGILGVRAE